ncbi:MAG: glycosyltransferase [Candidatus Aureabacteria bacterium]|nr:glycosyltransferase [Candidatus Auribacterota bacterium]
MKSLIGNPPWRKGNRLGVRAGSRWPFTMEVPDGSRIPPYVPFPFFLAYAAAVLERERIPVMLIDGIADGLTEEEYIAKVVAFNPDLVLHETSTASIDIDLRIAKKIKESTCARIALTGPHVSVLKEHILKENAFVDFILAGEYELTLLDLSEHLMNARPLEEVKGLSFRKPDGTIQTSPRRPSIKGLDSLPWPARHFLPMENYRDAFCDMPHPMLQMWASRGCPYRCVFCLWPDVMYGDHEYRIRDPGDVVDEVEYCQKKYGFKSFYFDDDTFNLGKARIITLCREIKKRNLGIPWAAMCRADAIDEEILREMKDSGLIAVKYGIESASQKIVNASGKKLDLKKAEKAIELTRRLGIRFHLTFTFGLPGETSETIKKTIEYALEKDPDCLQFSLATPFPGTQYYERLRKTGHIAASSWEEYDGSGKSVIRTDHLSNEELEHWLSEAYRLWGEHQNEKAIQIGAATEGRRKVSLYIPCYNAAKTLKSCLESILAQTYPVDEIIIVDDGSTDETVAIASRYPVKIIRHQKNFGLAASRNTAFRTARNEFVAAVDADVALDRDWLKILMANFTQSEIAGACGKLTERYQNSIADRWRAVHCRQHFGDEQLLSPDFLYGSNNVLRIDAVVKIGLYDLKYRSNYEDVNLGHRLRAAGYTILYQPAARAEHLKRDGIFSALDMDWRWWIYYYEGAGKYSSLRKTILANWRKMLDYIHSDWAGGDKNFVFIDLLLFFTQTYKDLKYRPWLKNIK